MFKKLILKLTFRLWGPVIVREICRFYEKGLINSSQMHEMAAKFDRSSSRNLLTRP